METNPQKLYLEREHRFSAGDLENLEVTVQRADEFGGEKCSAHLLDFSRKGMKLVLPISVRFEESIKLELSFKNSQIKYTGLAQIRHIRATGDQSWQVGCSVHPSVSDEVISFLASSSGKERRRSPRIPVSGHGTLQRQGDTDTTQVKLQNISEGGFCLAVPNHHAVGERVKLEILNWDDELQTIDAEIRWQVSTMVGYFVGCNFAHTNGFEKLASCVIESRPRKSNVSRFVLTAAVVILLLPSLAYLMTYGIDSSAKAEITRPGEADSLDPKPRYTPRRSKPRDARLADSLGNSIADSVGSEIAKPRSDKFTNRAKQSPLAEIPTADISTNDPLTEESIPAATVTDDPFPASIIRSTSSPKTQDPVADQPPIQAEPDPIDSPMRMWTDDSGQYRIEATLVQIKERSVILKTFDDTLKVVPIERLSKKDLDYLKSWASKSE